MRPLEDRLNHLTDMDWGWWPVLSLRPRQDADIDNRVLLKISPVFGSVAGLLILALRLIEQHTALTPASVLLHLLIGSVGFFFGYKLTFAHAWNLRARRLRSSQSQSQSQSQSPAQPAA